MKIPNLSYSTLCCGKPSKHIYGGKDFLNIKNKLKKIFLQNGTKNIYTLCPNCFVTLSEFSEVNVQSAWSLLDDCFPKENYNILDGKSYSLHDPCPIAKDIETADHVRSILNKMGVEILEFENNKEKTICCGKKNMLMALEPEKGNKLFELRASQAPSKNIVTYCASCKDTFIQNSFNASHVLELMFQTETDSSWINRYKAVKCLQRSSGNARYPRKKRSRK
ncbi:MAG: heterodisulfide reductase-related iron-sulfur binding cluster [Sedimentibacter sp.]